MASSAEFENGTPGFQIAPMVDVVFVLMLFFMASAGMKLRELELPVSLPTNGVLSPTPPIVIMIDNDGRVSINNQTYAASGESMAGLRQWLSSVVGQFGIDEPVIVRPSSETLHERIMQVLNAARASGVTKVTFG